MLPWQVIPSGIYRWQDQLGLTPREISAAFGVTSQTLTRWRDGKALPQRAGRRRFNELLALEEHLSQCFTGAELRAWLRTDNMRLGGITPAEVIRLGYFDRVKQAAGDPTRETASSQSPSGTD